MGLYVNGQRRYVRHHMHMRVVGTQDWSGRFGTEKNFFLLSGTQPSQE